MTTKDGNGDNGRDRDLSKPIVFDHLDIVREKILEGLGSVGLLDLLLTDRNGEIELGRQFFLAQEEGEFARQLLDEVLPAQRRLMSKLGSQAAK